MKYSSTLLKRFISVDDSPENIADNLILKTCEIEEIIERKVHANVVIGFVKKTEKHPEADKLTVCQVDCAEKGIFQILCGADNVGEGQLVATALPGAYLSSIDLKISSRKLRGLDSNGMICAKWELGISEDEDSHGIWVLTEDFDDISMADVGVSLIKKYPWLDSYILDVDNKWLTHRPDLTGHFGVGVELNAIYENSKDVKILYNKISEYFKTFENTNIIETLEYSKVCDKKIICETEDLRSYILMELNNIELKKSTFYTRLQLLDLGLQPRNNWVDISNLILFLTGQPVHFFDADLLEWDIVVRNAKKWEKFVDLFEKEHILLETDLVICDQKKILALAWVVWGLNSGVTDSTKNIIVEIANFDPVVVRKTWTRLGLRTDAEIRFEKNISPVFSLYALLLVMDVLGFYKKDLGQFKNNGLSRYMREDLKKNVWMKKEIDVDFEKISSFIFGKYDEKFADIAIWYLEWLGFDVWIGSNKNKIVKVPFWRWPGDMNIQEDVYEEVVRLYGYNNVEWIEMQDPMVNKNFSAEVFMQRLLESFFVQDGKFDQVETYPWVDNKYLKMFGAEVENLYGLQNAINPESPNMRDSMLYNLFVYVAKNSKFFDDIRIFDIGKVWNKNWDWCNKDRLENISKSEKYVASMVGERMQIGGVMYKKGISERKEDSLLEIKSLLNSLFEQLEWTNDLVFEITSLVQYHPKKQAEIVVNIGWKKYVLWFVGSLHPLVLKSLKISENASVTWFTLFVDNIIRVWKLFTENKNYHYETLQDQIIWRDLSFIVDSDVDFGVITSAVKNVEAVKWLEVFDLYKWENLGEWKKSLAFKFKIIWDGKMTTDDINSVMDKVIWVCEKAGGKLRDGE